MPTFFEVPYDESNVSSTATLLSGNNLADTIFYPTGIVPIGPSSHADLYALLGSVDTHILLIQFFQSNTITNSTRRFQLAIGSTSSNLALRTKYSTDPWTPWALVSTDEVEPENITSGTLGGEVVARPSTSYGAQLRNITMSNLVPTPEDGEDGDIWLVYET